MNRKRNKQHHHDESSSTSSEDTSSEEEEIEEAKDEDDEDNANKSLDYKQTVLNGSFLPAICLLQNKQIEVDTIIDENQGLRLLHYASYFGKIKALKVLCEVY